MDVKIPTIERKIVDVLRYSGKAFVLLDDGSYLEGVEKAICKFQCTKVSKITLTAAVYDENGEPHIS